MPARFQARAKRLRGEAGELPSDPQVMLRKAGAPAALRIGVRPVPFAAHAWVEIDGQAVNEPQDFITQLVPFPGLGG